MNAVKPTLETLDNRPAIVPIILIPGWQPLYVRREDDADVMSLLQGERQLIQEPGEPEVRRVLDMGAREGAFAVYCRLRWPYAWCDCLVSDPLLVDLCRTNAPYGTRTAGHDGDWGSTKYDLVRVTPDYLEVWDAMAEAQSASILFFDGVYAQPKGFKLAANGMRGKHSPFSWWIRES